MPNAIWPASTTDACGLRAVWVCRANRNGASRPRGWRRWLVGPPTGEGGRPSTAVGERLHQLFIFHLTYLHLTHNSYMDKPKLLRVGPAAQMLGIHPQTLRLWTRQGRIACRYMGVRAERRYTEDDVLRLSAQVYGETETATTRRRAVLYVRVSGSTGQESSLSAQEEELRAACERDGAEAVAVVKDRASGLNERRVGLLRAISMVADDKADEIRVTHADRLARFGVDWLRSLIEAHGGTLVIEHGKSTAAPTDELLADFMALVASFSGRLYGQRSAALRRKLLATAQEMTEAQEMANS